MNLRTRLIAGVPTILGLCLIFAIVSPTQAQFGRADQAADDVPDDLLPKTKGLERTDLFGSPQQLQQRGDQLPELGRRRAQSNLDVARLAYIKLRRAQANNQDASLDEALSRASLEWFEAELNLAHSRSDAIKSATGYLQREGIR